MTQNAPGNDYLHILLALLFTLAVTYAAGRLHEWYRHALERDLAWREGYDRATHSLYRLAVDAAAGRRTTKATGGIAGTVGTAGTAGANPRHASPSPAAALPARAVASVVVPITDAPSSFGRHAARPRELEDTTQILIADEITQRRLVGGLPPTDRSVGM